MLLESKPAKWCWSLTWKARGAELEVLAQCAEQKSERARRIPCIRDTNVVRGWRPASDPADGREGRTSAWLLRITLAQLSRSRFGITLPDAFAPLFEFLNIGNTHADQLTLAEFSALRIRRLVQNLNMMAIARSIEVSEKQIQCDRRRKR